MSEWIIMEMVYHVFVSDTWERNELLIVGIIEKGISIICIVMLFESEMCERGVISDEWVNYHGDGIPCFCEWYVREEWIVDCGYYRERHLVRRICIFSAPFLFLFFGDEKTLIAYKYACMYQKRVFSLLDCCFMQGCLSCVLMY